MPSILQQLDSLIHSSIMESKSKVLLLVDEAQLLTQKDPVLYASMRWWLRQVRSTPQIVAVFAGTLMSLANYVYQVLGPTVGWSRDPSVEYTNFNTRDTEALANDRKLRLYEPFFTLTTMAMEHPCFDAPGTRYEDALHDIRRCGKFGRPLFAVMLHDRESESSLSLEDSCFVNHSVSSDRLYSITLRVLLSKTQWWQDSLAKASVLATRVQMGLASYDFVLESTSKGYGNLVQFRSPMR